MTGTEKELTLQEHHEVLEEPGTDRHTSGVRPSNTHITKLLFSDEVHAIRRPTGRLHTIQTIVSHPRRPLHHTCRSA